MGFAMTSVIPFVGSADSESFVAREQLDALVQAMGLPRDARTRAAIICGLVHEMCAAVEARHGSDDSRGDVTDDELLSIRQLASAAQDHRLRMSFRSVSWRT